jgi:diguanylate cyclase (GGDEF)-like protein
MMENFLSAQLDFVLFFYGLAFLLLGGVCLSMRRARGQLNFSHYLGSFALLHGLGEWLDLFALLVGDTPVFAIARTCLLTFSFLLLMEFGRLNARQFGMSVPGRWWYVPLVLLIGVIGVTAGLNAANGVARYTTGFVGALAAAWVFARHARKSPDSDKRLAATVVAGWVLYGIAAGAIVPQASFWPASAFNYASFAHVAHMPIQLVRGGLACCIAFSIWGIGKRTQAAEVSSERYSLHVRSMCRLMLVSAIMILVGGWTLTQVLGDVRTRDLNKESLSDINLLADRFDSDTSRMDGMARALASSPTLLPLLSGGHGHDGTVAKSFLNLSVAGSGADAGYVFDRSATVVASFTNPDAAQETLSDYAATPEFRHTLEGEPGYRVMLDNVTGSRSYYSSYPVHADDGVIAGVAVLRKSLDGFAKDLGGFNRSFFLIDADGLILLTDRTDSLLKPLWPSQSGRQPLRPTHSGELPSAALLEREVADSTWTNIDGVRRYMRRRFDAHGQWSLVLAMPESRVFASRFLGIVITMLVTCMVLIFLYLKDRAARDRIELERRLTLQDVARDLGLRAATDPLTGLFNRLRFDEALAEAIARGERYKMPFSLVLYDVDRFKAINDTYGHQVGDRVLVCLSELVSSLTRSPDLVARWGGEEFVILTHGLDLPMACQVAERLRMAIEQALFEQVGTITCSFGVAEYVVGDTAHSLLARADSALYRAKSRGRNRVAFAPEDDLLVVLAG